jgi:hypothetical protein
MNTIIVTKPPAQFAHGYAPREEECRFQIEQDKQDCDEVVAHVELHARVFEGFEAAFVRESFAASGFFGPAVAQHLGSDTYAETDEMNKRTEIIFEVHD